MTPSKSRGASSIAGKRESAVAAPPPLARDPWAWLVAASLLPLALRSLGAPLGEPVAEDFDFLHRALIEHNHSLLDGGGSLAFWRPLSHQVYYGLLGPLLIAHPRWIAALHALLLALGSLLIYRTLRRAWPGRAAAAAAAFPLLAESTRAVIAWPSHVVDVGPYLCSAIALHEASRRRMATALGALGAALLFKEVAVVTALLLPWLPGGPERSARPRWIAASLAVVAVWACAYLAVRASARLELPHGLEANPALLATPLATRLGWAIWNSVRSCFSLALAPGRWDLAVGVMLISVIAGAALVVARSVSARRRLRAAVPLAVWGSAWFLLSCGTLAAIFPLWAPARTLIGRLGLGIALVGALEAAHPALIAALMAAQLAAFAVAPAPPARITATPEDRGAFTDFVRITRLQRLMAGIRETLHEHYPRLPRGARIGQLNLPLASEYALGGSRALQVWYRDSTVRWVRLGSYRDRPSTLQAIVEYESEGSRQIALVEPPAMAALLAAGERIRHGDWSAALPWLDRADSIQRDPGADAFRGAVAGNRALGLAGTGHGAEAEREAERGLALWREGFDARYVLATLRYLEGRLPEAKVQVDSLLGFHPSSREARALRDEIRAALARSNGAPGGPPHP